MRTDPPAPLTLTLGGNATVLIQHGDVRVLTDPWLSDRIGPWPRLRPPGLAPSDVAAASVLLISHAHPDHLDAASLAAAPRETPVVTPGGTPLRRLQALGFQHAQPLAEWEEWEGEGVSVTAVPSVHTRWCLGYVVRLGGQRVYFAGDAGPGTPFAEIGRRCGPLDVALLPVGGSRLAVGPLQRHLTPILAAQAAVALQPRLVIPMHWGHVACVPAALDHFRGTASGFLEALKKQAPGLHVLFPSDGAATPIVGR